MLGIWWASPVNPKVDKQEICRYVHNVQSDTAEYAKLLQRLANHRIVLLGEQTHFDGGTFTYKERLMRNLYERCGYDVILYEASMYDMWFVDKEVPLDPLNGLYYFWCNNHESRLLWKFYEDSRRSERPIVLGGFDVQYTGNISDSLRFKRLEAYLNTKSIDIRKYTDFVRLHSHIRYLFMSPDILDSLQITRLLCDIDRMAMDVKNRMETDNSMDILYYKYLQGLKGYLEVCGRYGPGKTCRMELRDSLMADNFKW